MPAVPFFEVMGRYSYSVGLMQNTCYSLSLVQKKKFFILEPCFLYVCSLSVVQFWDFDFQYFYAINEFFICLNFHGICSNKSHHSHIFTGFEYLIKN